MMVLGIAWPDRDDGEDLIPVSWFQHDQAFSLCHELVTHGKTTTGICDLRVDGKVARFDYRPYRTRRDNDVHAGVMEIRFTSLRRLTDAKVSWLDADRDRQQIPYEVTLRLYEPEQVQKKRIKRGQPGPRPSEWSEITSREDGTTFTYLMRFGGRDVWKLGISKDPEQRRDALNFSVPEEVLGERWEVVKLKEWGNGITAWRMEQAVLSTLNEHRTGCERVLCSKAVVDAAWTKGRKLTAS